MGWDDGEGVLHLGAYLPESDAAWLAKWRAEVDAEVDRRASLEAAGEERRRALRAFVEECRLVLGRMPRADEAEERWDGTAVRGREPGAQCVTERSRSAGLDTYRAPDRMNANRSALNRSACVVASPWGAPA
jgi:O-glycosyl hydrolase